MFANRGTHAVTGRIAIPPAGTIIFHARELQLLGGDFDAKQFAS
jgi:hypothetical protein